jgi:hypothetical protein
MSIVMPCASIKAATKNAMIGAFKIAPLASGPPDGGIIIDGGTWTVSKHDMSGISVAKNFDAITAGKVITIQTPSGSNTLTVTNINKTGDHVVITGTQSDTTGVVYDNEVTGLWLQSPAALPCGTPGGSDQPDPVTYCDRKADGTLAEYLAEHPDEAAAAAAYIAEFCPDVVITTPCDWSYEELAEKVEANPELADEWHAFILENCPECASLNWLQGYISSRDEGFIPPG